jgi:hypothetical protein
VTQTLADAYREAFARRRMHQPAEWATIAVESADFAGRDSVFLGVAIMDGHWKSEIHSGQSTVFRVEAGEHGITVHLGRRCRVAGYRGRAEVSLPVVVEPGEHLDLVFGVAKISHPPQMASIRFVSFVFVASLLIAFGVGWNASPVLQQAIAWASLSLGMTKPWSTFVHFVFSTRGITGCFMMYAWVILAQVWFWHRSKRVWGSLESPYFLSRRPDPGTQSPVFKKQYVDPFE